MNCGRAKRCNCARTTCSKVISLNCDVVTALLHSVAEADLVFPPRSRLAESFFSHAKRKILCVLEVRETIEVIRSWENNFNIPCNAFEILPVPCARPLDVWPANKVLSRPRALASRTGGR
jgi:hypothetical protein